MTQCCVDFYPQLNQSFMGGNSLNVASMSKKLDPDAHVSVITSLGNDNNGAMILDFLSTKNIDTSRVYIQKGVTANNQLRVDNDGERFSIEGTWRGGVYDSFKLSNADWQWVVEQDIVAIPANNPNFAEMIARKHPGQILSVDYLDVTNKINMLDTVQYTDIAFITARPELLDIYRNYADMMKKLVVVTMGAHGCCAFLDGNTFVQPAIPVPRVTDTTGCGDAFQAAFAIMYLKSHDIQQSLLAGATAAADIIQFWGGVGNIS